MLIRELMTSRVACCTPSDTARTAANLMRSYGVGAIPVVWGRLDPLLEGIVTDRDLCRAVVSEAKNPDVVKISELMTPVPVTCEPEFSVEDCEALMGQNQVRRIPVVDKRGRCVGIVSQADIARYAPPVQVGEMVREISKSSRPQQEFGLEEGHFYCGQLHDQDEVMLLNRRRELRREVEVSP
jgi:CBS domain-containing protein